MFTLKYFQSRPETLQSTTSRNTSSRLMSLPRELRDLIYSYLGQDIDLGNPFTSVTQQDPYCTSVMIRSKPDAALLSISKQFSIEYAKFAPTMAVLVIRDRTRFESIYGAGPFLQDPLRWITHARLYLRRRGKDSGRTGSRARQWAKLLTSVASHPLRLEVIVEMRETRGEYCYPGRFPAEVSAKKSAEIRLCMPSVEGDLNVLEELEEIPGIEKVEVRYSRQHCYAGGGDPSGPFKVYGIWTKDHGWRSARARGR